MPMMHFLPGCAVEPSPEGRVAPGTRKAGSASGEGGLLWWSPSEQHVILVASRHGWAMTPDQARELAVLLLSVLPDSKQES